MVDFSCALKLSMPLAVLSAMRECGEYHITVKGGKYLEALAKADTIVFDKTGTLTRATPQVVQVVPFSGCEEQEVLQLAACLEEHFPHSMANAVVRAAKELSLIHISGKGGRMMEKTQAKPLTAAQQRQRDKKRRTWLRAGVQLFFFVSMPGAFVAGFSGVKQLFLHIGAGEVLSADSFTLSLLGLCGFTLLFDRFFCGYACAVGSLGDAVWALSGLVQKKLFHRKKQLRLPERAVLWGQKVKYLLLADVYKRQTPLPAS